MKIAILGSGNVGSALGTGWAKKNHSVIFGVRDRNRDGVKQLLEEAGKNTTTASVPDAVAAADVIVLALPWTAAQEVVRNAGSLSGKIILDCTNPLKPDLSGLELGFSTSAAEQISEWAPQARVVKIFNTTGANNMANPRYPSGPVTMLYCGNDVEAKQVAAQLAGDLGFDPTDAGGLEMARVLEPFALLWIQLALRQGLGTGFALNVVRR